MISPSTPIARGIQISWPKAGVTRSAMLVLPLPGAPKRNSPRPELIAGPRRSSICRLSSRSAKAPLRDRSAVGCCPVERLGVDAGDVVVKRDGGRAEVGALLPYSRRARSRPRSVSWYMKSFIAAAPVNDQLVALHLAQQLVDQHERQLDLFGDFSPGPVAAGQEKLQDQRLDDGFRQAGGRERFRLDGHEDLRDGDLARRSPGGVRVPAGADLSVNALDPLEHRAQLLIGVRDERIASAPRREQVFIGCDRHQA